MPFYMVTYKIIIGVKIGKAEMLIRTEVNI